MNEDATLQPTAYTPVNVTAQGRQTKRGTGNAQERMVSLSDPLIVSRSVDSDKQPPTAPLLPPRVIRFNMAVNDYDGLGIHTRHLHACEFEAPDEDLYIHLECTGNEIVCDHSYGDKFIRVGRRKFPILSYGRYIGNMMWDAAKVTPEVASEIAEYIRKSGNYEPDDGSTVLWDAWSAGLPLFAATGATS